MFTVALVIIAKTWKQPKCPPTDGWINKMWEILNCICTYILTHTQTHTQGGILLSHKIRMK